MVDSACTSRSLRVCPAMNAAHPRQPTQGGRPSSRHPRMRALIVDDEAPARAKLRRLLSDAGDVEIVGEASTGRQAIATIKRVQPDVVFLDIQMPGLDGFAVLDALDADKDD